MNGRHITACLKLVFGLGLFAASIVATAQPPAKVQRIAVLAVAAPSATWRTFPAFQAFLEGLRELGHVEGENLAIVFRSAESDFSRLPYLTAELVALKPEVFLVGTCGAPLDAIKHVTSTIPIVVATCTDDMVASGIVASLAHPGGQVTGLQKLNPELSAKRLELLKEVVPQASRVAVVWDPGYSNFAADWRALRAAARILGVTLLPVEVRGAREYETAFATIAHEHAEALLAFSDAITNAHGQELAELAAKNRLPTMYPFRESANAGGLMSYGPSIPSSLASRRPVPKPRTAPAPRPRAPTSGVEISTLQASNYVVKGGKNDNRFAHGKPLPCCSP